MKKFSQDEIFKKVLSECQLLICEGLKEKYEEALNSKSQNAAFKITGEKFDQEEIDAYLLMALEEFICWNKSLSAQDFKRWVKFKILQFACSALSINSTLEKSRKFRKKASYYRNKTAKFFY